MKPRQLFAEELEPRPVGVDFGGADDLPLRNPAHRIQEELLLLRKQNGELHAKLKRLRAKMKHHLAERDRYRDLYNEAAKKLQADSARHPNF
jgi:hypothetical protein